MSQKWLLSCKMGGWSRSRGGYCSLNHQNWLKADKVIYRGRGFF